MTPGPSTPVSAWTFIKLGWLEFALALVGVPMMALLPQHLSSTTTLTLGSIGLLLFAVRAIDACVDPWVGSAIIQVVQNSRTASLKWMFSLVMLAALSLMLVWQAAWPFNTHSGEITLWLLWFALLLILYLSITGVTLMFLEWHLQISSNPGDQSRLVGAREAFGVMGLLLGSALSGFLNATAWTLLFASSAILGVFWLKRHASVVSNNPQHKSAQAAFTHRTHSSMGSVQSVLSNTFFKRWLVLFLVNGLAGSVSATLIVLFLQDVLNASNQEQGLLLALYFLVGLLSIPLWIKAAARWGWARSWQTAGLGSAIFFAPAVLLGAGDVTSFAWICVLSGVFVGADFVIPGAWLGSYLSSPQFTATHTRGAYLGWWQFLKKANLAISAGLILPLLSTLGYIPGTPQAVGSALPLTYVVIPVGLKIVSVILLSTKSPQDPSHASPRSS